MVNKDVVLRILNTRISPSIIDCEINKLKGDASNRTYFRIETGNNIRPSYILMKLSEPEGFKKSEEMVTANRIDVNELPYINILNYLSRANVAVPELIYYDKDNGLLLIEDLGDRLLEEDVRGKDDEIFLTYYKMAIDELLKIQVEGTKNINDGCIAYGRMFDVPLLMWEFDHYIEFGIEASTGTNMDQEEKRQMRSFFQNISEEIANKERCLTHRDYHSRNLMIHHGRIRVIDFQDALMGPNTYDLASLLRDSYIQLKESLIDNLINYYLDKKSLMDEKIVDRKEFRRLFDLTSIQRNLKAAGRFVYISKVKKNDRYLQYIPQTLNNVKNNLLKYEELKGLREIMSRYIKEIN